MNFSVGTVLLPMDDHQPEASRLVAYGFVYAVLQQGIGVYRVIQAQDETAFMKTDLHPDGVDFLGGPILFSAKDAVAVKAIRDASFSTVVVETLFEEFQPREVFASFGAPSIGIIYGSPWLGRVDKLLDEMGVAYFAYKIAEVEAAPSLLSAFDLVVDDCVGWFPFGPPAPVISVLQDLVVAGKELIFTDLALADLMICFPGKITASPNGINGPSQLINFIFHNNGDFVTQYAGSETVGLRLHVAGAIITEVTEDVQIAVDSNVYPGYGYGIAVAYFKSSYGLVEAFCYHSVDQLGESFETIYAAAALLGNKLLEGYHQYFFIPIEDTNILALNLAEGSSHTVTLTIKDREIPVEGVPVRFHIIGGPHTCQVGQATTDENGVASWTYSGTMYGTDIIVAYYELDGVEYETYEIYKTWIPA